ncbi:MAG: 2-oxoacid:acceptor oxidoreductase family protein [Candidatus Bipolaricaulia bacterium]
MRREVRLGGFGGQGIMLAGYILGRAAIAAGRHAVMTQAYGPEIRGARVAADVILDDEPIDYPRVTKPDISIFMFQEAYDHYRANIGRILIYDEDLVQLDREHLQNKQIEIYPIRANRIAEELGRRVVANIAMLGSFTVISGLLPAEVMEEAVLATVPRKSFELNKEAFRRGLEYGRSVLEEKK